MEFQIFANYEEHLYCVEKSLSSTYGVTQYAYENVIALFSLERNKIWYDRLEIKEMVQWQKLSHLHARKKRCISRAVELRVEFNEWR